LLSTLVSVNPKRKASLSANAGHVSLMQAIAYSQDRSADGAVAAAQRKMHNGKMCMLVTELPMTNSINPAALKTRSVLSPFRRPARLLTFMSQ
jgi:hypothetical protein